MTDEQAQEIFANEHCNISKELAGILARAIEAAVLPELDVLCEYTGQNGMREWNDVGAWLRPGECIALVAAPKPAQASPLDLMECLQDRPIEPSKAVQGKCVVQAEKQEPGKDEPVAFITTGFDDSETVCAKVMSNSRDGAVKNASEFAKHYPLVRTEPLYTRPQPDLTAEVERLRQICRDAYEVWAGSNGIPEPITCVEAYMLQLLIQMRDEVKRGLK